jgi:uncharacterized protein YndB with AHSA1/START domain
MTTSTDRIEKQVVLRAPIERVWRAISNAREFGTWFQADLKDDFVPGATVRGTITTKGHEGLAMTFVVERMEKERLLAIRWHPYAIEPDGDYANEPTTLVEFRLAPAPEGTLLVVTESGFDQLPEDRRFTAFEMNSGGWEIQLRQIAAYLADHVA